MSLHVGNFRTIANFPLTCKLFTRSFGAGTTVGAKKKRSTKKKKVVEIRNNEVDEEINSLVDAHPFCLPKEQVLLPTSPITIPHNRIESGNERFYVIQDAKETFSFPGVTHVLSATMPRSFIFAMKNWQKNMTKEHGEEGFREMQNQIRTRGHDFHMAVGDYLIKKESEEKVEDHSISRETEEMIQGKERDSQVLFQNRLLDILKALSQRLKGLFISNVTTNDKVLKSVQHDKSDDKQVKQDPEIIDVKRVKLEPESLVIDKSFSQDVKQEPQIVNYLLKRLPKAEGFAQSVEHVVNDISEVYAVESTVSHLSLGYVGTLDLVAKYKGEVCLIDWKTSYKPRPKLKDIHDYPLQAVAYAGAINNDKNYSFNVSKAIVVVVYISGAPADVHVFDHQQCMVYWRKWLERLDQYQKMFAHDLRDVVGE